MSFKISRAITTIAQMLADRGSPEPKLSVLSEADIDELAEASTQGIVRVDAGSRDIIFFSHKTKSSDIAKAASDTAEQRLGKSILVTIEPLKKTQKAAAVAAFGPTHESFTITELSINISRHTLVPRHEIVPSDQVQSLPIISMVSSLSQLPLIKRSDAMAKYIGARPGDVVKVTRVCPTAGTQVAYRLCCN